MDESMLTARAQNVLRNARAYAAARGGAGAEHILLELVKENGGVASKAIQLAGVDHEKLLSAVSALELSSGETERRGGDACIRGVLGLAKEEALRRGASYIGTEHLLAAVLREENPVIDLILKESGGDRGILAGAVRRAEGNKKEAVPIPADGAGLSGEERTIVERYTQDLTGMARRGELDPALGREAEIERIIQILSRRVKNNPCLVGEPGVGKTAVVGGLAQRIVSGNAPGRLLRKRLLTLDIAGIVAGTKFRGEFEERVKTMLEDIRTSGDIILFIDGLHTIAGAGAADGALDAAGILKPALGRGELQVIGAATPSQYRVYFEKDAALERWFQPVTLEEPGEEQAVFILKGLRSRYEAYHGLRISDEAVEAAVSLSRRYIGDRFLPDKAIDLMDEAAARAALKRAGEPPERLAAEVVSEENIAEVVSTQTGIPVTRLTRTETERLIRLASVLRERVIGQDEAVEAVSRAVRRGRIGLKDPGRPIGSFLFLGSTGVGKTELCRALAEAVFGDESAMIRLDMSEYMEKHMAARLIGAPPGYV